MAAFLFETQTPADFIAAMMLLLYSGFVVNGLAFTLQLIAQCTVSASVAALILSFETVFALLATKY